MKPIEKMNYEACLKLFKEKNEVNLFSDFFFGKSYNVSLKKINDNIISVNVNGNDSMYFSNKEFGMAIVGDSSEFLYKTNLANLFIKDGYRLSYSNCDDVVLSCPSDEKYIVPKMFIIDNNSLKIE